MCENLDLSQTSISDERIYNSLNVGAYQKNKVQVFWKGLKNLKISPTCFDVTEFCQNIEILFSNFVAFSKCFNLCNVIFSTEDFYHGHRRSYQRRFRFPPVLLALARIPSLALSYLQGYGPRLTTRGPSLLLQILWSSCYFQN